ncbi:protein TolA [Moraxella lacunata]|uniref:Protein TolA n=1 Tax=Moraxella lacunata TaxID=477 RepID=A0A378TVQ3_MORLA|nr:TonB C-terminal domain-containing protein [Moraxella lacunata]STZ64060.1 protein TolA [Moraxella lacunata]
MNQQTARLDSDNIGTKEPNLLLSLVGSVVVHGLIVTGVLFAYTQQKPLPETVSLEASLVTGDDLAGAEAAIADAFAEHQAQSTQTDSTQSTTTPDSSRSAQLEAYYDDLAKRERAYQAQMAEYAKSLDDEILSEIEMQRQAMADEERERARAVAELEVRERSNDDIARENSQGLNEARERRDNAIAEKERANRTDSRSLGDGQSTIKDTPTTPTVGRGGAVSGGNSSGSSEQSSNRNEVISALQRHIRSHWRATGKNQTLQVKLKVDGSGNVLSVQVSGGDEYLREQLEDTVHRASPLTPIVGTNYRDLNFNFKIN